MLKHKRNVCEYFFQCIFFGGGGGWKGGRRPLASVEFFGFENILITDAFDKHLRIKINYKNFE